MAVCKSGPPHPNRGLLTEKGLKHIIACVEAMKAVMGDEVGLALDCGPGWTVPDAIRLARALEPLNLMWLEDMHHWRLHAVCDGRSLSRSHPRHHPRPFTPANKFICGKTSKS